MSRTYIKLKITTQCTKIVDSNFSFLSPDEDTEGGVYLDAITAVRGRDKDSTILEYAGQSQKTYIQINKPVAEIEKLLADANRTQPDTLDWRDFSGYFSKQSQAPKSNLSNSFRP